jgi:hypothetical protein
MDDWHNNYEIMSKLYTYDPKTGFIYSKRRDASDFYDTGNGRSFCSAQGHADKYNQQFAGQRVLDETKRPTRSTTEYKRGKIGWRGVTKNALAHRVIFLLHHGYLPKPPNSIDHINHDGTDNRICNLREATPKMQSANTRMSKANKSGYRGVSYDKSRKKWRAQITKHGKKINLGLHTEMKDAIAARKKAQEDYYKEINHGC